MSELDVYNERLDDTVLLLHVLLQVQLPQLLDNHLERHGNQLGLSWGWLLTVWLVHILTQSDHRKVVVREWVQRNRYTLEQITEQTIRDTDFTDDRLTRALTALQPAKTWSAIETELAQKTIRVYDLPQEVVRFDATTVSGYHTGGCDSLFQLGHSKDDPNLLQVKVMQATLDPLGMPLVTQVVPGQSADDPLYVPVIKSVLALLWRSGLLFVGDSKMSALSTRAFIDMQAHFYLMPLPNTGETAQLLPQWIETALANAQILIPIPLPPTDNQPQKQDCLGYCFERGQQDKDGHTWTERVLVVYSPTYAQTLHTGLHQRLTCAREKLLALTPQPGRGKRVVRDEAALRTDGMAILKSHRVEGLLCFDIDCQTNQQVHYVGRGRGGPQREQRVEETRRYQITNIVMDAMAVAEAEKSLGWRAFVTNAPETRLSLCDAVILYRQEWRIERGFHRLKGVPLSLNPLFVQRDDQVEGLIHLMSIALRFLSLIEYRVRRGLQESGSQLVGLHLENPKKGTCRPTTERLLRAFDPITLTILRLPEREIRHVTPLTSLQVQILELLDLSPNIYTCLAEIPDSRQVFREW
jgi:transposase